MADDGDLPALFKDHELGFAQGFNAALAEQAVEVAARQPALLKLAIEHPPMRSEQARSMFDQMGDAAVPSSGFSILSK